jgi:hypothetical protein
VAKVKEKQRKQLAAVAADLPAGLSMTIAYRASSVEQVLDNLELIQFFCKTWSLATPVFTICVLGFVDHRVSQCWMHGGMYGQHCWST